MKTVSNLETRDTGVEHVTRQEDAGVGALLERKPQGTPLTT
jgi:hypothetical protein